MRRSASHGGLSGPGAVLQQASVLMLAALIPAVLSGWVHPRQPGPPGEVAGVREVTVEEAQALAVRERVLWIDARAPAAYQAGHVPGAVNITEAAWEALLPNFIDAWNPGQPVIVYCDSTACGAAQSLARRLVREFEATNIHYLQGGWEAWQQSRR